MRNRHIAAGLALVAIAVLAGVGIAAAQGREGQPAARTEYAWLYLPADGPAVLSAAEREITILPSSEVLSGAVDSVQPAAYGYRVQTRTTRDDHAAALDIAAQQGWEAVSAVPHRNGTRVLLKRGL